MARSTPGRLAPHRFPARPAGSDNIGGPLARGVTVARLTLDQLVLVRIQAGQLPIHGDQFHGLAHELAVAFDGRLERSKLSCRELPIAPNLDGGSRSTADGLPVADQPAVQEDRVEIFRSAR